RAPRSAPVPYTTLFRSHGMSSGPAGAASSFGVGCGTPMPTLTALALPRVGRTLVVECGGLPAQGSTFLVVGASRTTYGGVALPLDRKSTRLNSSHVKIA